MQNHSNVAELLHAGLSDRAVARELHTDAKAVSSIRATLGIPKARSGKRAAATVEELFQARTEATPDGHLRWTGTTCQGTPSVRFQRRNLSAYRIAFRIRTGREPVGKALPACGTAGCVAPDHIDDQPMREHNRSTFNALFGGIA
ncbi:hypothetical protein [Streptomyces sp. NPDC046685]|uniref:hypothetical protein n=1 Tax=Streptomyces sp. NPDC046685 TaxID=3157202 RepID=UPI0033DF4014